MLCSSIPVAMVRILGSKMMSLGLKLALPMRRLYDRVHISTLRSEVVALGGGEGEREESSNVRKQQHCKLEDLHASRKRSSQ